MPDFFDRLLARSMPMDAPFESVAGAVPARARVPGRFERTAPVPEPDDPWLPGAPPRQTAQPPVPAIERVTRWMARPTGPIPPAPPATVSTRPAPVTGRVGERTVEHIPETVAPHREPEHRPVEPGSPVPLVVQHTREVAAPAGTPVVISRSPLLVPPKATPAPAVPAPPGAVSARQAGAAATERTVHVRIGRIEVTAPGPAQPEPKPRPQRAGPTLSLERYLNGGHAGRGTR